jgi:hypothetical protein
VATHRHQDHVSGFAVADWAQITVGEVWMPWTENPADPEATAVRDRQSRFALGLHLAFSQPGFGRRWLDAEAAESLRSLAANSLTNEPAMRTLHSGFRGRPMRRFVSTSEQAVPVDDCPGLTIHVLGPARDLDVVRDMNPPSGQSYLRFGAAPAGVEPMHPSHDETQARGPFARSFGISPMDYELQRVGPILDDRTKQAAAETMRDDDFAAAVSLDKAVNGTSLMLMFEFHDAFLLFPGDAQWGTWADAMKRPATRDLLARTTFYKVGHHGSHNATPVDFLERVLPPGRRLWAAATSVRPIRFWPEIPRIPLMTALGARTDRLIRSDQPETADGVSIRPDSLGVDFAVPY